MNDKPLGELLEALGQRPKASGYSYEKAEDEQRQRDFDEARREIRTRVSDAEWARADAEGYRTRMLEQARQIADLESEIARLTRAHDLVPAPNADAAVKHQPVDVRAEES